MRARFRKASPQAPAGYFAWEAAGLRWLREASPGVVEVLEVGDDHLTLAHVGSAPPDAAAAAGLGRALAAIHAAGAEAFGCGPPGWQGDGWLGPLREPLPLVLGRWPTWGVFYAEARLLPLARLGRDRGVLDAADVAAVEAVARRLDAGGFDTGEQPARLHGDLWSGNVLWGPDGAVLIDPAAHGGHREADLAMLQLFGCPHLDDVVAAYHEAQPLPEGWRNRVLLHQLHPLLLHAVLFGGGYVRQARAAAEHYR